MEEPKGSQLISRLPNLYAEAEVPIAISSMYVHLLASFNPPSEPFSPEPLKRVGASFVKADGSFLGQDFLGWLYGYQHSCASPLEAPALAQLSLDMGIIVALTPSDLHLPDAQVMLPTRSYALYCFHRPYAVNAGRLSRGPSKPPHLLNHRLQGLLQEFVDSGFCCDGGYDLDAFYHSSLWQHRWIWALTDLQNSDFSGMDPMSGLSLLINMYNILWLSSAAVGRPPDVRKRATVCLGDQCFTMEELLRVLRGQHRREDPRYSKLPRAVPFEARTLHYSLLRARGPPLRPWAPMIMEHQLAQAATEYHEQSSSSHDVPPHDALHHDATPASAAAAATSKQGGDEERFIGRVASIFRGDRSGVLRGRDKSRVLVAPYAPGALPSARVRRPQSGAPFWEIEREKTYQELLHAASLAEKVPRLERISFRSLPFPELHAILGKSLR